MAAETRLRAVRFERVERFDFSLARSVWAVVQDVDLRRLPPGLHSEEVDE